MVYNGYYKVMSNIPKMGHLPTPVETLQNVQVFGPSVVFWYGSMAVAPSLDHQEILWNLGTLW